jgi:tRNA-Thr(GGU) m(6)t(6)A37 methyltransferase TsaA
VVVVGGEREQIPTAGRLLSAICDLLFVPRAVGVVPGGSVMNLTHIGRVHSHLMARTSAPRQAHEGAPHASLEIRPAYIEALDGLKTGMDIWVLTWLHQADRTILKTHPRNNPHTPLRGVFATRSPDRPNPIGLHRTKIVSITDHWIRVESLEAINGTPIIDIKPILEEEEK